MAKINCDVDGVVCDFVPALFERLRSEGFDPLPYTDPLWRTWNFFNRMPADMKAAAFAMMEKADFWRELPNVAFSQEAIRQFREAGHKVHWITTAWES